MERDLYLGIGRFTPEEVDIMVKITLMGSIDDELDLLERHIRMLKTLRENEPMGIIRLSEQLKIPQHKIRYSLRMLEKEGLIKPTPEGAICTPEAEKFIFDLDEAIADAIAHMKRIRRTVRDSL
jgi:predicted transcriptional regulator